MDNIFSTLSNAILEIVESHMTEDDDSTNEELVELFIQEFDLTLEQAEAAVDLRSLYLNKTYLNCHGPMRWYHCLVFDPRTQSLH